MKKAKADMFMESVTNAVKDNIEDIFQVGLTSAKKGIKVPSSTQWRKYSSASYMKQGPLDTLRVGCVYKKVESDRFVDALSLRMARSSDLI